MAVKTNNIAQITVPNTQMKTIRNNENKIQETIPKSIPSNPSPISGIEDGNSIAAER